VLDAFLDSGTTVIAAERTGRRCYALELDPGYVDAAIRRWQTPDRRPGPPGGESGMETLTPQELGSNMR
jgi:DNA modification methylase